MPIDARRCRLYVLALFVIPTLPGQAIQLPGQDLPALLRVNSETQSSFGQDVQTDHRQLLISRGGGMFLLVAAGGPPGSHFFVRAFQGLGTRPELAVLGQALVNARIGGLRDCALGDSDPGHVEITWYGRNGRQNFVRIELQAAPPPASGACAPEVSALLSAIERFSIDAISGYPQD